MNKNLKPYAPVGIYVSLLALLTAAGLYFVYRQFNLYVQIALGVVIIGVAVFVLFDPQRVQQIMTGRQARYGSNAAVLVLAFTGILAVLNYLVYKNPQRWDLTEDKLNTLSQETLDTLAALEEPVRVTGFYTGRSLGAQEQAKALLDEYVTGSDGEVSYGFIDPEAEPLQAQQAGITQDQTLVLQMGDRQQQVLYASETELTSALVRLVSGEELTAYFLTGHGEYDLQSNTESSYSLAAQTLGTKNYQVVELNLLAEKEIPADASLLVIAGPTVPLSQDEVDQIAAFSESGGAMIVMEEPPVLTDFGDAEDPLAQYLADDWGIVLGNDMVVSPGQSGNEVIAIADQYGYSPITDKLSSVATFYPSARSIQLSTEAENVNLTPLVMTAPYQTTWAETDIDGLLEGVAEPNDAEDIPGPITLAVAGEQRETGSRIVVFGDADFANDYNFASQRNGDMLVNSADWVTNQEELINLTPREQTQRFMLPPFPAYTNLLILVSVFVIPAMILGAGLWVWLERKRRS